VSSKARANRAARMRTRVCCLKFESKYHLVIACDKRGAFAQGSEATKQSTLSCCSMDCFASLAMTAIQGRRAGKASACPPFTTMLSMVGTARERLCPP
jgi:hypothetical protein